MRSPLLAARIFGTPLLIARGKLAVIVQALERHLAVELQDPERLQALMEPFEVEEETGRKRFPLQVLDGVAVIDVFGTLVQRHHGINAASGLTSYERITAEARQAIEDPGVRGILFNIDSPGGEVAGCFDATDELFELRGKKPMIALANEFACSGAYAIGSACDKVYGTQTAMTGSVGVVLAHRSERAAAAAAGVIVTEVFAGARKVDCSPFQDLDEASRGALQAQVDHLYGIFVQKVARNRGIQPEQVRGTEAGIFVGAQGIGNKLVDGIRRPAQVLAELTGQGARPRLMILNGGALMKPKAGQNLATGLEEAIAQKAEETGETREQIVAKMAGDASAQPEEVEAVLTGATACPTPELLKSMAGTLGKDPEECMEWGRMDGCEYPAAEAPADAPAEPAAPADAAAPAGPKPKAATPAPVALEVNPDRRRFLMVADQTPKALADTLVQLAPQTVAHLTAGALARIKDIRAAALPGQEALAEKLAEDPAMSVMEAKAVLLDAEKARRGRYVKAMEADEQARQAPGARVAGSIDTDANPAGAAPDSGGKVHLLDAERDAQIAARWEKDAKIREEFPSLGAFSAYAKRNPQILAGKR